MSEIEDFGFPEQGFNGIIYWLSITAILEILLVSSCCSCCYGLAFDVSMYSLLLVKPIEIGLFLFMELATINNPFFTITLAYWTIFIFPSLFFVYSIPRAKEDAIHKARSFSLSSRIAHDSLEESIRSILVGSALLVLFFLVLIFSIVNTSGLSLNEEEERIAAATFFLLSIYFTIEILYRYFRRRLYTREKDNTTYLLRVLLIPAVLIQLVSSTLFFFGVDTEVVVLLFFTMTPMGLLYFIIISEFLDYLCDEITF